MDAKITTPAYENADDMPQDIHIEPPMPDDDKLLEALLGAADEEKRSVFMPRFKSDFVVRSITSEEYARLEKRCKYPVKNNRTKQLEEKTDQDRLSYMLIATACVSPNWSDPRLLSKYNTSDPSQVVKKRLFIGEISMLTDAIMDVSGFADGVEVVKNSYDEAEKQQ